MPDKTARITFQATGIQCAGCAEDMEKVLRTMDGIHDASIKFTDEIIDVTYDPDVIDPKQVYVAVRKLGFRIRILTRQ